MKIPTLKPIKLDKINTLTNFDKKENKPLMNKV